MQSRDLIQKFKCSGKRFHVAGDENNGVLIALDVEGRVFAFMDGLVLNRVNEDAIWGFSTRAGYVNPGGDGLWPAPEGSKLGFEYSTGSWRVPAALTSASWQVIKQTRNSVLAEAEVDLVNASGVGVPCIFSRDITVSSNDGLTVTITEGIEYIGVNELSQEQAVVAPWTLCQFDCGSDCTLYLPRVDAGEIWDLYADDSSCHRKDNGKAWEVEMVTDFRFQLGMSEKISWLEFVDRKNGFAVHRSAARLAEGLEYIDLADRDFTAPCDGRKVRFSAYCDPSGFMEIEAAGGTPVTLKQGAKTTLTVTNRYKPL